MTKLVDMVPSRFVPTPLNYAEFGRPRLDLDSAVLLDAPSDIPEGHIAYNPSSIWTLEEYDRRVHILYSRVEPDRASSLTSHLGNSVVRPYQIDLNKPTPTLTHWEFAADIRGEDPALTKINRSLPSGKIQSAWLLSTVLALPKPDKPNEVASLQTMFYAGETLGQLEPITEGPEGMKDVRVAQGPDPDGTELLVYGRPQPRPFSGNPSFTRLASLDKLTAEAITEAPILDENLLPVGSGIWGGVNDVLHVREEKYILAAHRAWTTDDQAIGRHYEAVLYGHDITDGTVVELGVLATADMFPEGHIKDDVNLDLHDVVFTGGGYNGTLQYMTFGVRDGAIGLGTISVF